MWWLSHLAGHAGGVLAVWQIPAFPGGHLLLPTLSPPRPPAPVGVRSVCPPPDPCIKTVTVTLPPSPPWLLGPVAPVSAREAPQGSAGSVPGVRGRRWAGCCPRPWGSRASAPPDWQEPCLCRARPHGTRCSSEQTDPNVSHLPCRAGSWLGQPMAAAPWSGARGAKAGEGLQAPPSCRCHRCAGTEPTAAPAALPGTSVPSPRCRVTWGPFPRVPPGLTLCPPHHRRHHHRAVPRGCPWWGTGQVGANGPVAIFKGCQEPPPPAAPARTLLPGCWSPVQTSSAQYGL